jgi:eukaryotic-like serine/threonine-protein kinase
MPEPSADFPPSIGPYRVAGVLGRRHPATAYKAVDAAGHAVVVEVMSRAVSSDPEAVARFHQAVERLAEISHPNVLAFLGSGEADGQLYLVHEPWDGPALGELLRQRQPSVPEAISVFKGILKGLGQAHQRGIVHRDLNPTTVLVSPDLQQVKLTGFGLGKADALAGTTGTLSTGEVGLANLYYLSPEQMEGKPADARSDLYSAGTLFHQLLTGRAPGAKLALPSQQNPQLPPEVDPLVLKCLARRPEDRYSNVPHLLGDLARLEETLNLRLVNQLQGISRSTSRLLGQGGQGEGGETKSRGLLWVGIGVGVIVLVVVAYFLLR